MSSLSKATSGVSSCDKRAGVTVPNPTSKTEHEERSANNVDWIYGMVHRELTEKGFLDVMVGHSTL